MAMSQRSSSNEWKSVTLCAGLLVGLISGCGGGGGSSQAPTPDDPTIAVTTDVAGVNARYVANLPPFSIPAIDIRASVSPLPVGTVFVVIVQDRSVLEAGLTYAADLGNGSWLLRLQPDPNLPPGLYSGNLTLQLCKDAACSSKYRLSGNSVSYSFEVLQRLSVGLKADGVSVGSEAAIAGFGVPVTVKSGALLEFTSTVPVTWRVFSTHLNSSISASSSTSTVWTGRINDGVIGGGYLYHVQATALDGIQPTASFMMRVD
jgi:hypothetical protein